MRVTTATTNKLDQLKYVERVVKNHLHFSVPMFIIKDVAYLVCVSKDPAEVRDKIQRYLVRTMKLGVVGNIDLMMSLYHVYTKQSVVLSFWDALQTVDYEKLAQEKESLLGETWNDNYQHAQTTKKGLNQMINRGIQITINISGLRKVLLLHAVKYPLVWHVRNARVVKIGNFNNSKISHIVHDLFDHLYFFLFLKEEGFFEKTSNFRKHVGNPHIRDIFSRESELIASVAYERRCYVQNQPYFRLRPCDEKIHMHIDEYFPEECKNAYREKLKCITDHGISVYHIYDNIITELTEQIRKVGTIKIISDSGVIEGHITDVLNSDYLQIIIDILYLVVSCEERCKKMLLQVYLYIESILYKSLCCDENYYSTVINLSAVEKHDGNKKYSRYLKTFFNI